MTLATLSLDGQRKLLVSFTIINEFNRICLLASRIFDGSLNTKK
jgi:hypothetical protein